MSSSEQPQRERSTEHTTFVIERTYRAAPERVFAAWSDADSKRKWFGPPELPAGAYSLDFRVGGSEHMTIALPDGSCYTFDSVYQDIVEGQRIVYSYDMHHDEPLISVSLATIEFHAAGTGTKLIMTEQGVFLDGHDTNAEREHGTNALIDNLGSYVDGEGAAA